MNLSWVFVDNFSKTLKGPRRVIEAEICCVVMVATQLNEAGAGVPSADISIA